MALLKMPPPEKFVEAWSAVASNRVSLRNAPGAESGSAQVISSNSQKTYEVHWHGKNWFSNDNATYWQRYPGYPVLAVLMLRGLLPYPTQTAEMFKNVNWNEVNKEAHGNYHIALERVYAKLGIEEQERDKIQEDIETATYALNNLDIELTRKKLNKQ